MSWKPPPSSLQSTPNVPKQSLKPSMIAELLSENHQYHASYKRYFGGLRLGIYMMMMFIIAMLFVNAGVRSTYPTKTSADGSCRCLRARICSIAAGRVVRPITFLWEGCGHVRRSMLRVCHDKARKMRLACRTVLGVGGVVFRLPPPVSYTHLTLPTT